MSYKKVLLALVSIMALLPSVVLGESLLVEAEGRRSDDALAGTSVGSTTAAKISRKFEVVVVGGGLAGCSADGKSSLEEHQAFQDYKKRDKNWANTLKELKE